MRRFSIRELFWLTLVVAMGVAWWLDRGEFDRQLIKSERDRMLIMNDWLRIKINANVLVETVERAGWTVDLTGQTPKITPPKE